MPDDLKLNDLGGDDLNKGDPSPDNNNPPPGDKPADRPENVPEKFWDAEKGTVRIDEVLGAYTNLETEHGKLKGTMTPPKEYKLVKPEEYDDIDISDDDPMFSRYREFAKENKMTQAEFDRGISFWLGYNKAQFEKTMTEEVDKLGGMDKAKERVGQLKAWAKNNLSEKGQKFLEEMSVNAATIEFFEELRKNNSVQDNPPDTDNLANPGQELTEERLHDLMKKEEYWNPLKRNPELVKQVTEGFQKLYAGKKG